MYIKIDNVSHKAALPTSRKADYAATVNSAKKILGIDGGLSLLKLHSASMPCQKHHDSGIGKLNSEVAMKFIEMMAFYTGINAIKEFPFGQATKTYSRYYGPYNKTSLTIGEENINLTNIIENKGYYGNILTYNDRSKLESDRKSPYAIHYEIELGTDDNYPIKEPLKIAYNNYKKGFSTKKFANDFDEYKKQEIVQNTYSRLALYPVIHNAEPYLFEKLEQYPEKQKKFEQYKKQFQDQIDFFNFCQFLAQREHNEAKTKINKMGIDLFGDCLIGFSKQEIWAHPDAFMKNTSIGNDEWGLPSLKFEEILDKKSEAHKVFDDKISFFLKHYDGVRFDVGWCYAIAKTYTKGIGTRYFDMGHQLFDFIEKRAKEIKGSNFDTKKLIYETLGFDKMYSGWEINKPKVNPNMKNIVNIATTEYEHKNKAGWGYPEFYIETGLTEDELIIGTNNHDGSNLRAMAEGTRPVYEKQIQDAAPILSKQFNIPIKKILNNPSQFIKAKFAQLFTLKNQFLYFVDVLGSREDMDCQNAYTGNYRFRIDENFERQYHNALQQGFGFNLPESLRMVMKSKNLDKNNPDIYSKLTEYASFLRKSGAKTEEDANKYYKGI